MANKTITQFTEVTAVSGSDEYETMQGGVTLKGTITKLAAYLAALAQTLTNKTLTTPTIASFTNATHDHSNAAGGGTLNASAIGAGTVATARLGSGSASSITFLRGDQTWAVGGDTVGPAASTDNAIARFDTTTGKLLQNSGVTIDDSGNLTCVGLTATGAVTIGLLSFAANAGVVVALDMPITGSVLSSGTPAGYDFSLDGTAIASVRGLSDGAGAITVPRFEVPTGVIFSARPRFVQTTDVTVTNTTTETTLLGTVSGSKTLEANALAVGRNFRGILRGRYSGDAVATGTLRIKAKLGSVTILDTTALTMPNGSTNKIFEVDFDFSCRTVGVTGTIWAAGKVLIGDFTGLVPQVLPMVSTATSTVDTTGALTFDVTVQWGTADADNSVTVSMAVLSEGP